jgi:hypothetical protein
MNLIQSRGAAATLIIVMGAVCAVTPADVQPDTDADVRRLSAEAARMYAAVKKPHPGELRWQQIPWLTDLQEAARLAKAENRPLLLFVSGDDPLEKC